MSSFKIHVRVPFPCAFRPCIRPIGCTYFITSSCNVYSQTIIQQPKQLYRLAPLLCARMASANY